MLAKKKISKSQSKIKRKPFPRLNMKGRPGFSFEIPGPVYYGGALHYINKNGKITHSNKLKVPKSEIMTLSEFKKRFYDPEKALKNYLKKYD